MYDFTHFDYVRQQAEYQMLMNGFLRDCKAPEEKDKAGIEHQGIELFSIIKAFVAGLIACGIISLFT